MRVGPLGCLGLVATLLAGWMAGRLPAVLAEAPRMVAAVPAPSPPVIAAATPVAAAPQPIVITMPAAPPPQVVVVREVRTEIAARAEPAELRWTLPPPGGTAPVAATGVPLTPPPAPAMELASSETAGFALASLAYAELKRGDRRAAAGRFEQALAADPQAANAPQWQRELKRLKKRWSGEGYTLLRDDGIAGLGVTPLLGGGQSGAQIAYTPNPLGRRPVYAVIRTTVANSGGFGGSRTGAATSQLAAGVKWQVLPQLSVSGERLFAVRHSGRDAWTARLAGGVAHRFGPVLADAYAEAGIVGFRHADWFAGLQGRAAWPFELARLRVEPGFGVWSGVQNAGRTVDRFDLGPTVGVAWDRWNVRATADYRLKVAGNARPGSGPVVTISGAF